jgi:hypothetical protein
VAELDFGLQEQKGRRLKAKKEEGLLGEVLEGNPTKKTEFQTARIPPLSFRR